MVKAPAEGPCTCTTRPTLSVRGMACVHVESLLTLSDGSGQRKVRLHHPFLVVAVDNRLRWHRQRVTLGHVLGQGGEGLLSLEEGGKQKQSEPHDLYFRLSGLFHVILCYSCSHPHAVTSV